jgi:iron complex transport system ATP-binding protein
MLVDALARTAAARPGLTTITVTHDVDSLPPQTTHVLFLRNGAAVAAGPLAETMTAANLSACFGIPLEVAERALG